jgi:hypothetical protein
MPHNRHRYEIGKYENFIQIQPQTSYSKWQQYKHDLPIDKCKHKVWSNLPIWFCAKIVPI